MDFKEQFPILNQCTYLNTANSGILSKSTFEWRRAHDTEFLNYGSGFRTHQNIFLNDVRNTLASFFHAKAGQIFLVSNFSFGYNVFLDGLPGDQRFLLLQGDYPSVTYPVQSRGFICDSLPVNEHLEDNIIEKIRLFKPTVFAFSLIQYTNGMQMSLEFTKRLKSMFPELILVADGTQFCGTAKFNFKESGLDVLISSGYKWMLAGYGNGFVLLKDRIAKQLYSSVQNRPLPLESFKNIQGHLGLYFEPGHLDTLAHGTLQQSVFYLEQLGHEFIENKLRILGVKAKAAFAERGLLEPAVLLQKEPSHIYVINISDELHQKILAAGIVCISRGQGTRVGFHFYNTEEDIDHLLEVIDRS
ncbi:Selenocysteine lyase/Cysteine desulfurase [Pedobacter westerhofensis]|uniref:Selenocysteine lyase/Cysteine desulfurase n=1 Tax=Pedobacter westerhofensis TaxID=425512 RepID=A0A521EGX3_9SPHI|nr:aminotransferase class V-fold PLP-dependent enzyme [Pedobacter westerhofensis]SMO83179.1 Selenocysteine lyase/Cysteine desulfurase [Pedobacter westerhofensis]